MTEDILSQDTKGVPTGMSTPTSKRRRTSVLAALLSIFLAIVMILLGERALFDLNSVFNPVAVDYADVYPTSSGSSGGLRIQELSASSYASDRSALSSERVYYPSSQSGEYRMYKLLIHAALVIPVFLLMFVFYFWTWRKQEHAQFKVIAVSYLIFGFWMMLHLLGEAFGFVMQEYRNVGVYVVLGLLAATFTWLMVMLQKRVNQTHGA